VIGLLLTRECEFDVGSILLDTNFIARLQEVFGGNAVADEYHIGRHVANLFVTQTYEGQSDIHGMYERFSHLQVH